MDFNNNVLSPFFFFFNFRIIDLQRCVAFHCTFFTLLRWDKKVTGHAIPGQVSLRIEYYKG